MYNIWRNIENGGKHYYWILKQNPTGGGNWGVSLTTYDDQRLTSTSESWEQWNLDKQANGNYFIRVGHINLYANPDEEYLDGSYYTYPRVSDKDAGNFEFILDCADGSLHDAEATSNSQVMAVADSVTCSASSIEVDVPVLGGGTYEMRVKNKQLGYTESAVDVTITTFITSISPAVIGSGGDNSITLNGSGFNSESKVYGCTTLNDDGNCNEEFESL